MAGRLNDFGEQFSYYELPKTCKETFTAQVIMEETEEVGCMEWRIGCRGKQGAPEGEKLQEGQRIQEYTIWCMAWGGHKN